MRIDKVALRATVGRDGDETTHLQRSDGFIITGWELCARIAECASDHRFDH